MQGSWAVRGVTAAWRGVGLGLLTVVGGPLLASAMITAMACVLLGFGILLVPLLAIATRWTADRVRELSGRWAGVEIASPYRPRPEASAGFQGWWDDTVWTLTDPATWRDLLWLLVAPVVAGATALLGGYLVAEGVFGVLLGLGLWEPIVNELGTYWYTWLPVSTQATATAAAGVGVLYALAGVHFAPPLLKAFGRWNRGLLAPTEGRRLSLRVQRLAETRSDAVDASAAELRRIERDLHDGAQARLVAMGMSLGAIEHLLDRDPDKARLLLAEARESSVKALAELRDLVRGIHPPVLSDRGLTDAVRALALDHPLDVEVVSELSGRLDPAVEAAAYFAVSEMLTNAAKHSGGRHAWVDLRHENGALRVSVSDDGAGGADPARGGGLRGVERRIGTFDGVLALSSPPGGPTTATMELPCRPL